jgi:RHS repeat-associated protein
VWAWEPEAFGNTLPNGNPSNLGNFTYNLRFPGQYHAQETGLYYNYYRDYDPGNGRYAESDPIGLAAGVNNPCPMPHLRRGYLFGHGLGRVVIGKVVDDGVGEY